MADKKRYFAYDPTESSQAEPIACPNCGHPIEDHDTNGCNGPWQCDCGYTDYQVRDEQAGETLGEIAGG